ncbi:MAG: PAS domain-containing sensor histidine kinase [Candidatus Omnitrophica bacterium]|nr:PAS domain-containing sensor histidine kinase [Candidatus Omnitrophota bacterium]
MAEKTVLKNKLVNRNVWGPITLFIAIACVLLYYFHVLRGTHIVFTHLFYIPIILAALWWKRKGLAVAFFLALFLVLSNVFFSQNKTSDDYIRGLMFIVVGIVVAVLSERIAREKSVLEETKSMLESITHGITEEILLLTKDYKILWANNTFLEQIGEKLEDVKGKYCYKLTHNRDLPCQSPDDPCPIQNILDSGKPMTLLHTHQSPHGTVFYEVSAYPVRDKEGNLSQFVHVSRDFTERKKLEEQILEYSENLESKVQERTKELKDAKSLAENALKAKSQFLANMSHELITPLNSILGFTEVLEDEYYGKLNEKQKDYLKNIYTSGKRLLDLIDNILDLAKVELLDAPLELERLSLKNVLESSVVLFKEKALRHNIELALALGNGADVEIELDQSKLRHIMYNLLSNAFKFTKDGGSVKVRAEKYGPDSISVSVEDSGIGIKPEDIQRLFIDFEQIEQPYTKRYEGAGVGLALTRKLVESYGGKIWAESEFGKGSTFKFTLPVF